MPELPEVETIKLTLEEGRHGAPSLLGKEITGAEIRWPGVLVTPTPDEFSERVTGQRVQAFSRRGKHLLIHLSKDTLIFHLRMSGDLLVEQENQAHRKHDRLLVYFQEGTRLAFNNIRKFGRVWLTADPEKELPDLGPEPLAESFRPQDLHQRLHSCSRQIKYFLLDQEMIAGLGNIYTDESLYKAGLHPQTKSDTLDPIQVKKLWRSIRGVLQDGIKHQGTSIDWMYRGGDYQHYLSVYGQEGEPCQNCGTIIQRMKIAQRSTYFCPSCQPPPL